MRTHTSLFLAAALFAAGGAQRPARADSVPFSTNGVPLVLKPSNIPQALTNLGYRPTLLPTGTWYVTVARPTLTIPVGVELSSDNSTLWFRAKLGAVDTLHLPTSVYRDLLSRGAGTERFYFVDRTGSESSGVKDLLIAQPCSNRFVTQDYLRKGLDEFCNTVVRLEKLWKSAVEPGHSYGRDTRREPFGVVRGKLLTR